MSGIKQKKKKKIESEFCLGYFQCAFERLFLLFLNVITDEQLFIRQTLDDDDKEVKIVGVHT